MRGRLAKDSQVGISVTCECGDLSPQIFPFRYQSVTLILLSSACVTDIHQNNNYFTDMCAVRCIIDIIQGIVDLNSNVDCECRRE